MQASIKKIIKEYAKKLKEEKYPFSALYLFGSYAKGNPRRYSDIDVAVISDKLKRNWNKNEDLLWIYAKRVNTKIEPFGLTRSDFKNNTDPMVYEIKKTGIKVV